MKKNRVLQKNAFKIVTPFYSTNLYPKLKHSFKERTCTKNWNRILKNKLALKKLSCLKDAAFWKCAIIYLLEIMFSSSLLWTLWKGIHLFHGKSLRQTGKWHLCEQSLVTLLREARKEKATILSGNASRLMLLLVELPMLWLGVALLWLRGSSCG